MEKTWGLAMHKLRRSHQEKRTHIIRKKKGRRTHMGRAQLNPLVGMKSGRGFERSKRGTVYTFIYGVTGAHATTI